MTIEKGKEWGTPGHVPTDVVRTTTDPEVAQHLESVVILGSGDLYRGLGQPVVRRAGDECTFVSVDVLKVAITAEDGSVEMRRAVAHVCVGHFVGRGRFTCLVNAGFVDGRDLAPRGHPGDGVAELVQIEARMSLRQRLLARRRARLGTHLPHPLISVRSVDRWQVEREGREKLKIDGCVVRNWKRIDIEIEPNLLTVIL